MPLGRRKPTLPLEGFRLPEPEFPSSLYRDKNPPNDLNHASCELAKLRSQIKTANSISSWAAIANCTNIIHSSWWLAAILIALSIAGGGHWTLQRLNQCTDPQVCPQFTTAITKLYQNITSPRAIISALRIPDRINPSETSQDAVSTQQTSFLVLAVAFSKPWLHVMAPQYTYMEALDWAQQASELTQTAVTPEEWQQVTSYWRKAISVLEKVSASSLAQEIVQEKLVIYRQNLVYAEGEIDCFREAVNSALAAASLTQTARYKEEWETISALWIEAIDLMKAVSSESPYYATAQQKILEYSANLAYSQGQVLAHTPEPIRTQE